MPPEAAMEWSKKQILDWQEANKKQLQTVLEQGDRHVYDYKWNPPEVGCMKINVDAAVKEGQNWFALGMVARNHLGKYISGKTMKLGGQASVVESEMIGILEALSWAKECIPGRVTVESDSFRKCSKIRKICWRLVISSSSAGIFFKVMIDSP
ncbi:hypothetical protein AgCh_017717 [Apium graveolens]